MQLGERMKAYEAVAKGVLTMRMPKIIRIDGRAFHTYTRGMKKPFDDAIYHAWVQTAVTLCSEITGAKLAYFQSDEISILVTDYDRLSSQGWFDNQIQKIASVSASIATAAWNLAMARYYPGKIATFDARVFAIPREEVVNYFIWRQRDAVKNSINALASAYFPQRRLQGLSCDERQDLLFREKGINWAHLPGWQKNGAVVRRFTFEKNGTMRSAWQVDEEAPLFSKNRDYIERLVYPEREEADLSAPA